MPLARKSVAERKQRLQVPAIEPLVADRGALDVVVHLDRGSLAIRLAVAIENRAGQLLQ
jgi:hypothetical protein